MDELIHVALTLSSVVQLLARARRRSTHRLLRCPDQCWFVHLANAGAIALQVVRVVSVTDAKPLVVVREAAKPRVMRAKARFRRAPTRVATAPRVRESAANARSETRVGTGVDAPRVGGSATAAVAEVTALARRLGAWTRGLKAATRTAVDKVDWVRLPHDNRELVLIDRLHQLKKRLLPAIVRGNRLRHRVHVVRCVVEA